MSCQASAETDEPSSRVPRCPRCQSIKVVELPRDLAISAVTHGTAECQSCGAVFSYLLPQQESAKPLPR